MTRRTGFTKVELLVVGAIACILTGLLLQIVPKLREVAARNRCADNLKQIALAAHNYQSANNTLPPGYWGPKPNRDFPCVGHLNEDGAADDSLSAKWTGSLVYLLPHLQLDHVYRQLRTMTDTEYRGAWWETNPDWTLAHTQIPIFQCPSDIAKPGEVTVGMAALIHSYDPTATCPPKTPNYAAGMVMYYFPGEALGKTNYTGVAGPGFDHGCVNCPASNGANYQPYTGAFYNRSKTKIEGIADGSSNTIVFGELLGGSAPGRRDFQQSWMGTGTMATFRGLCRGPVGSPVQVSWAGFSSNHVEVVQFAFGDGHVGGLRPGSSALRNVATGLPSAQTPSSNDWWTFQALAGISDGDTRGMKLLCGELPEIEGAGRPVSPRVLASAGSKPALAKARGETGR